MADIAGAICECAQLNLTAATSKIVPGATSLALRNNADGANNILIADSGAVTFRSTVGGITTLTATTLAGTLSTAAQPNVTSVGTLTSLTTGAVTSNVTANALLAASAASTSRKYITVANTGGTIEFGVESSAGGAFFTGGSAYAGVIGTQTATALQLGYNGAVYASLTNALLSVTATTTAVQALTVTGTATISSTVLLSTNGTSFAGKTTGGVTKSLLKLSAADKVLIDEDALGIVTGAGISATTGTFSGAVSLGNTVNAVSPTSPNRTVTIVIGGTTYYLAAKTTND